METVKTNFIWDAVQEDLRSGRYQSVHTRFPPEPNGYLHIGHCKALVADFLTAEHFGGVTNLRFDDTNPAKEETEYVDGIMADIRWLGFDWKGGLFFASEYYQQCYDIAVDWIKRGLAYVCELSPEEVRLYRGTLTQPGRNSPYRDRPVEESLRLFEEMKAGRYEISVSDYAAFQVRTAGLLKKALKEIHAIGGNYVSVLVDEPCAV